MSKPEKPHLNMVVVGHVDHGKSTMVGHLLLQTGNVDQKKIDEYAKQSETLGSGDTFKYAWVLDNLKEERERGVTIDLAFQKLETDKLFFTIIDAPGHRDFIKNMITGTSQADCAILTISAKKGEFEVGIGPGGQAREHAFLARTLGVNQLLVAISKMDDATVNFAQDRYEECKKEAESLLKAVGYDPSKISFVPVSGWTGDNLTKPSEKMSWYKGPTLIDVLNTFTSPPKPTGKPLRIPIQDVYTITGVGSVPVGRVETGTLKKGDKLVFMPSKVDAECKTIETHHTEIPEAGPGDNIGFNVRGVEKGSIRRGDVVGHPDNPPTVVNEFTGQIIVIYHPTAIARGYTPVMHAHTSTMAATFTELLQKIDPRTGQVVEENPSFLKQGDSAIVKLRPLGPIVMEEYSDIPQLGRFAVRDMGMTIAVGVVKEITEKAKA
ncbi:MAG: translation elongation factor EF-1 subunit alpha [Candidatus Bathyarchaeota archaeon]|nr:translation elongation factor EF-1 subunit alpha [Candidatus Bathyarchaeota archaeon]